MASFRQKLMFLAIVGTAGASLIALMFFRLNDNDNSNSSDLNSARMNNPEFFSTQQTFTLQENEFNELVRLANQGDSEAALRVYHHYALGIQDESDADLLWLFRAAELSHPTAINDLGVHLTEDYLRKKLTKADQQRGWQILSQAADTGNEEARKFVRCK